MYGWMEKIHCSRAFKTEGLFPKYNSFSRPFSWWSSLSAMLSTTTRYKFLSVNYLGDYAEMWSHRIPVGMKDMAAWFQCRKLKCVTRNVCRIYILLTCNLISCNLMLFINMCSWHNITACLWGDFKNIPFNLQLPLFPFGRAIQCAFYLISREYTLWDIPQKRHDAWPLPFGIFSEIPWARND